MPVMPVVPRNQKRQMLHNAMSTTVVVMGTMGAISCHGLLWENSDIADDYTICATAPYTPRHGRGRISAYPWLRTWLVGILPQVRPYIYIYISGFVIFADGQWQVGNCDKHPNWASSIRVSVLCIQMPES